MKLSHVLLLLVAVNASCRSRDAESRLRDVSPSMGDDPAGLELEMDMKALSAARLTIKLSKGELEAWSMLEDERLKAEIAPRMGVFTLDKKHDITEAKMNAGTAGITSQVTNGSLGFSGITGRSASAKIPVRVKAGKNMIFSREFADKFFDTCPTSFFASDGEFMATLRRNPSRSPIVIDPPAEGMEKPEATSITYRPDGLTWSVNCGMTLAWGDIQDTKVMAQIRFEIRLDADRNIFPGAASDPSYPMIKVGDLQTDRNGRGTRFFHDYLQPNRELAPIQRWNPKRTRIVVDDTQDSFGRPLNKAELGRWVQEGLKVAVADLRMKIPYIGKKLALTSEQPQLSPDIAFALGDANDGAGIATMLIDDKNGEIRQARIGIGEESKIAGRLKMLEGFERYGLIDDAKRSFHDSFLILVMHEFGHTLGLRHNFEGYGSNGNWGNDLQAAMSYAMITLPLEFISDKVEWKPHDLLSLQILYHDMNGNDQRTRQALIAEVLKYPLSADELTHENPFGMFQEHLEKGLRYLETTNNPRVAKFRAENSDWREKIKAIYTEAYGMEFN